LCTAVHSWLARVDVDVLQLVLNTGKCLKAPIGLVQPAEVAPPWNQQTKPDLLLPAWQLLPA
jgi:hypothetical protein